MELTEGKKIKVKVKNVMWPYKDRYAPNCNIKEFNYYEGVVVHEKWHKKNQIGLTT